MSTETIQKVPMLDLNAQYAGIEEDVFAAFKEVFEKKQFIQGEKVRELEAEIAKYCGGCLVKEEKNK